MTGLAGLEDQGVMEYSLDKDDVPQINYPPLFVESDHLQANALENLTEIAGWKVEKKTLYFCEWYLSNIAGLMFIVGSYLFNPAYSRDTLRWAAILFIVGSMFFMIASGIIFVRNNCYTFEDKGTTYNCILYIIANGLFVVGSVFFLPTLDDNNSLLITGLLFFVFGAMVFLYAPLYSVYRLLKSEVKIKREYVIAEIAVACFFIAGNAMFIIGSVLFIPAKFHNEDFNYPALQLYIVGSFCFFIATFLLTIKQGLEDLGLTFCVSSDWFQKMIRAKKRDAADAIPDEESANWTERGSGSSEVEVAGQTVSSPSSTWKIKESPQPASTTAMESPLFSGADVDAGAGAGAGAGDVDGE